MTWSPRRACLVPIALAAMLLAACGGATTTTTAPAPAAPAATDLNPHDPAALRDGGELRLAVVRVPDNWNYNEVDGPTGAGFEILSTLLPVLWLQQADGTVRSNPDYLTSVELTSTSPQVVTYHLNPKAHWSDGTPLSWRDLAAQADSLSGRHADYQTASTAGYEDVAAVERGATDQDARVTFTRTYADWKSMFRFLYPAELAGSAAEFNTGWLNSPKLTAGPFAVRSIDAKNAVVTVARDPRWWGTRPKLDTITFKVVPPAQLATAYEANQIDFYDIVSDAALAQRSRQLKDAVVRQAPATDYSALVLAATPGTALTDPRVRIALQQAVDTNALADQVLNGLESDPKPLGNHLFLASAAQYRDNSAIVGHDPAAAGRALDALGWRQAGQYRAKDGVPLRLRFPIADTNTTSAQVAEFVRTQLAAIGVQVDVTPVPTKSYFSQYVNVGKFDLATFRWGLDAFPLSTSRAIFYLDPENIGENYGRIGSAALNALYDEGQGELDPAKLAALEQRIDEEVWRTGSMLPLFQTSGAITQRPALANFGAAGYANMPYDWVNVGFVA